MREVEKIPDHIWIIEQAKEIKRLAVELGKEKAYTSELEEMIAEFKKWRPKFLKTFKWEVRKELLKEEEYFKIKERLRNIRQENKRLKDEIIMLKIKQNQSFVTK